MSSVAIAHNLRQLVGQCIGHSLDCLDGIVPPDSLDDAIREVAREFTVPGPPLVSLEDVFELMDLVSRLSKMAPGDVLDHAWGYVQRVDDGFRVANPHQTKAEGNWASDDVLARAQRMYMDHLYREGVTDQPL